jgi:K(+)-stimulated pyrophosphate-energized sodium pump
MKAAPESTARMAEIAGHVRAGTMAYLKPQYLIVGMFFVGLPLIFAWVAYGLHLQNTRMSFAFLSGGFFSGRPGVFGMKTATDASCRVAPAASQSLDAGLQLAFRSGAVMGLVVAGLALLDISIWFVVLMTFVDEIDITHKRLVITTTMLTFGMGASLQALFARVGGARFTNASDVGAAPLCKVEAGIPEDDPRNPVTIAGNVGDDVGDVAGMGADLYESYVGSILATAALSAAAFAASGDSSNAYKAVIAPMRIATIGTFLSIIGIFAELVKKVRPSEIYSTLWAAA